MVIPKHPIGFVSPDPVKFATEKTLTVTVTKNPDDDEALRITTADVSTPENTDKDTKRPIVIRIFGYGYSKGFVSRLGKVPFEPVYFKKR
jgi:hypothetical protein